MKKSIGVIGNVAKCDDCGKRFDQYKNGQALAAIHAKKYHHLVEGEVVLAYEYDGRASKSATSSSE